MPRASMQRDTGCPSLQELPSQGCSLSLPDAVAWKSSHWETLRSTLAASRTVEWGRRRGAVTQLQEMLLHGDTMAFCPVPPQYSTWRSRGSQGGSSGQCLACPPATLASPAA